MNVRLLGALLTVIGLVFAVYAYGKEQETSNKLNAMELQEYYQRTSGEVFHEDLVGVSRRELTQDHDAAKKHITWGLVLAAIGFAIALAGQSSQRPVQKSDE